MIFKTLLAFLAIIILGRQVLEMLSAELGRKEDLLRRLHQDPQAVQFAVLIPLLSAEDGSALGGLLRALLNQSYPREQVSIYVLASPETHEHVMALEQATRDRVHWLITSSTEELANKGHLTAWGVQRIISAGGQNRLFAFLEPTDIVREDFLSQISQKSTYASIMQGYHALKRLPNNVPTRFSALSLRVFNRIRQAGRAHLGLSPVMQASGWVIHQDILEKVPMKRFLAAFPQEYGMLLARCGYPVQWMPSVVVYKEDCGSWTGLIRLYQAQLSRRIDLMRAQLFSTVQYLFMRPKQGIETADQLLQLLTLPTAFIGAILLSCWFLSGQGLLPETAFWGYFFLSYLFLNVATMLFARTPLSELLFYAGFSPLVTLVAIIGVPLLPLVDAVSSLFSPRDQAFDAVVRQTRGKSDTLKASGAEVLSMAAVQEALALSAETVHSAKSGANEGSRFASEIENALDRLDRDIHGPAKNAVKVPLIGELPPHLSETQTVLLSHEKTTIECRVNVELAGPETLEGQQRYRLKLSHKGTTFQTQAYDDLEQAFEDLRGRLNTRGFEILSCGSCAYYHPRQSTQSDSTFLAGVCLENKSGVSLEDNRDVVTILSPRCAQHTPLSHHKAIVQAWQASLALNNIHESVGPSEYSRVGTSQLL